MPATSSRLPVAARRFGFGVAAVVNAAIWYVINVWPGWQQVPFLTEETTLVLWLVNISLIAGVVVNVVFAAYDSPWAKSLGDLITTSIGLVVLVRVWQVFPFDFSGYSTNWAVLARFVLVVAIAGSIIGVIVQFASLVGVAVSRSAAPGHRGLQ
jgi:hypothetical protein